MNIVISSVVLVVVIDPKIKASEKNDINGGSPIFREQAKNHIK